MFIQTLLSKKRRNFSENQLRTTCLMSHRKYLSPLKASCCASEPLINSLKNLFHDVVDGLCEIKHRWCYLNLHNINSYCFIDRSAIIRVDESPPRQLSTGRVTGVQWRGGKGETSLVFQPVRENRGPNHFRDHEQRILHPRLRRVDDGAAGNETLVCTNVLEDRRTYVSLAIGDGVSVVVDGGI